MIGDTILSEYNKTNKTYLQIFSELPTPHSPLAALTYQLYQSIYEEGYSHPPEEDLLEATLTEAHSDTSLYFFFLLSWASYCVKKGKIEQAKVLFEKAKSLNLPKHQKVADFILSAFEEFLFINAWKLLESIKASKNKISTIDPSHPRYLNCAYTYAINLINIYDFEEFHKVLSSLRDVDDEDALLYNSLLTFLLKVTSSIHISLEEDLLPTVNMVDKIKTAKSNVQFVIPNHFATALKYLSLYQPVPQELLEKFPVSPAIEKSYLCVKALLERDPKKSLEYANAIWNSVKNPDLHELIRVQIANKKVETAENLIYQRIENCGLSFLDHFFLSRLSLLKGEEKVAAVQFAESYSYCVKNDLLNRLNLEIKLSCELKPSDLFTLMQSVSSLAPQDQPTQKSSSAKELPLLKGGDQTTKIIGSGKWHKELINYIDKFSRFDQPVLIVGETGTGKELVAEALHRQGDRHEKPFISINCGALSKSLLESELFGYAKGAYTGADKARKGLIQEAADGVLFLDEMGTMPLETQASLLRVLENREYRPIGSNKLEKVNCRVVCATNLSLEEEIEQGHFRRDLFFRLSTLSLTIPPLRERRHDISLLSQYFLGMGRRLDVGIEISDSLREVLESYSWPGNVRQLRNEMEFIRIMDQDKSFYDVSDLRPGFFEAVKQEGMELVGSHGSRHPSEMSNQSRRHARIMKLFRSHDQLTRRDICHHLDISPATASRDLKFLVETGQLEKIQPTQAPRTYSFKLAAN